MRLNRCIKEHCLKIHHYRQWIQMPAYITHYFMSYCMSKKSSQFWYCENTMKIGQDLFGIQYVVIVKSMTISCGLFHNTLMIRLWKLQRACREEGTGCVKSAPVTTIYNLTLWNLCSMFVCEFVYTKSLFLKISIK